MSIFDKTLTKDDYKRLAQMANKTLMNDGWFILYAPVRGYPQILPIGLKRSSEAVWLNSNYLLENQEVGFITDTKEFIIGDGKSQFKDLKRYKLVEQKKKERKRKMKFLEALQYCKDTGNAITRARYSEESQKSVQWYLSKDQILVCQNYTKKPEIKSINKDYWIDEWIPYPGDIKKWEDYYAEILNELHELENEIGPLMGKIERYKELKARYDIDN